MLTATLSLIDELTDDDWGRPTPCVGWEVRDIIAHVGHIEGMIVHGFPQPDPPPGWEFDGSPLDQITNLGVESRRPWPLSKLVEEVRHALRATASLLARADLDWTAEAITPIGPSPRWVAVELRVTDLFTHYIDLLTALGRPIEDPGVPFAQTVAVGRAVRLTPWAWVKRVGASEGDSLQLDLSGPGGGVHNVTVEGGRAVSSPGKSEAPNSAVGSGIAYLLAVSGRHALVSAGGGLVTRGELTRSLLTRFRLVG